VGGIVISNHPATRKGRYVRAATVSSLQYSDAVKYPHFRKEIQDTSNVLFEVMQTDRTSGNR
jgi:hypothetical protein